MARAGLPGGAKFEIANFSVGNGGHDPLDPAVALTPDVTATAFDPQTFGPEPIDGDAIVNDYCPTYTCRLEVTEAVGELSAIALFGTIVFPLDDAEYGQSFLYAVGHFPLRNRTDSEIDTLVVTVDF